MSTPEDVIREALIQGDSLRELGERPYACVLSAGDAAIMSHRYFQPALAALDQLLTELEQERNDGEYLAMAKDENQALRAELEQVTFDPISTRHEDGTVTVDWPEDKPPIARITRELLLLLVEAPNDLLTELQQVKAERDEARENRSLWQRDAVRYSAQLRTAREALERIVELDDERGWERRRTITLTRLIEDARQALTHLEGEEG